jgi:8-oxoguanine deaminase
LEHAYAANGLTDIDWLYPCSDQTSFIRNAWILVQDSTVVDVGTVDRPLPEGEERISFLDALSLQGLSTLTTTFSIAHAGCAWVREIFCALVAAGSASGLVHLDPPAMVAATRMAAAELLLGGCTTNADHSYLVLNNNEEILEGELKAAREMGLRLHLLVGAVPTLEGDLKGSLRE